MFRMWQRCLEFVQNIIECCEGCRFLLGAHPQGSSGKLRTWRRGRNHLKGPYGGNFLVRSQFEEPRAPMCGFPHIGARGCSKEFCTRKFPPYGGGTSRTWRRGCRLLFDQNPTSREICQGGGGQDRTDHLVGESFTSPSRNPGKARSERGLLHIARPESWRGTIWYGGGSPLPTGILAGRNLYIGRRFTSRARNPGGAQSHMGRCGGWGYLSRSESWQGEI